MFQSRRSLIAILAAVGLVVVAAVYLIGGPHSNDLGTGPGRGSSSLAALATGPVANFVPAAAPAPVPNLEFKDGEGKTFGDELKRIGCTLRAAGDYVYIEGVADTIEKLINRLLQEDESAE